MLSPKNINDYNNGSKESQHSLEQKMQQDELNYLSSVAFEKFNVSTSEIDKLTQIIDKKIGSGSYKQFNTIFISVLCGLLIGISVFFVIFHKSQNHPSQFQDLTEKPTNNSLKNSVNALDTVFPAPTTKNSLQSTEHYATIANTPEEITVAEMPDLLPTKPSAFPEIENADNEELILQFIPNAPVVFMSNLKVTNYRIYYFKRSEAINLDVNTGVEAQYEDKSKIEQSVLNKSNYYFAHKIIQRSMKLFTSKNYASCIEELNMLYTFNTNDANAQFYLGMCYYNTGKFAYAQNYFQKNLDNENNIFHQESEYYQALCLLYTKQTDKAILQLQSIITNKGFYAERALEVLNKNK